MSYPCKKGVGIVRGGGEYVRGEMSYTPPLHPPVYNIKRSTVNVYKINTGKIGSTGFQIFAVTAEGKISIGRELSRGTVLGNVQKMSFDHVED